MNIDQNERIKVLMSKALDDAFQLQVAHLYKTWLSNPDDLEAAQKRAARGAANAIKVYRAAADAIDTWEG